MKKTVVCLICMISLLSCSAIIAQEAIEPLNAYSEAPPQSSDVYSIQPQQQSAPAPQKSYSSSSKSSAIPLRFCFLPNVWYWPKGLDVYGVNLGVPISYGEGEGVYGLDIALIASMTDEVKGLQVSFVNKGYEAGGGEIGLVNFATRLAGFQVGAVNSMISSDAVQLGIINMSHKSNGLQLGLLNIMENGFLPVFPLINFSM